jgi:hypothetical protein
MEGPNNSHCYYIHDGEEAGGRLECGDTEYVVFRTKELLEAMRLTMKTTL